MYIRGDRICGRTWEVYKRNRYQSEIKDGKIVKRKRGDRVQATKEEVQRYNQKMRERKLTRKLNANFAEGDLYLTLTYTRDNRPSPADAEKNLRKFIACLKRIYRKTDTEFKWVATTEIGTRGGIHHHLVIPYYADVREIEQKWRRYGGHVKMQTLYGQNFERIATYIAKTNTKDGTASRSSYSCSRNLIDPPEKRKKVKANSWREMPTVPKGWALEKDSLVIGVNPVTGHGYQFYRLIQIE